MGLFSYRTDENPSLPGVYRVLVNIHGKYHPTQHEIENGTLIFSYYDGVDTWGAWEFSYDQALRAKPVFKGIRPWGHISKKSDTLKEAPTPPDGLTHKAIVPSNDNSNVVYFKREVGRYNPLTESVSYKWFVWTGTHWGLIDERSGPWSSYDGGVWDGCTGKPQRMLKP